MKKIIICLLSLCCTITGYGQSFPDSVLTKYNSFDTQKKKGEFLFEYLQHVLYFDDEALKKAIELASEFKNQNDEVAADYAFLLVSIKLTQDEGNYIEGLNRSLPILHRSEERNDTMGIAFSLVSVSYCYKYSHNYEMAIAYLKKAIPLAVAIGNEKFTAQIYNDIGTFYSDISMPDSGLVYGQKSVATCTKIKFDTGMPYVLSTVAENYIINKDYDIALPFLRRATGYAKASSNESALGFLYNDFSEAFIGTKQYDSAFHYIQQAINIYRVRDTRSGLSRSYSFLSQCFEETNKPDSANKYFRLAVVAKDSLFSREKTKLLESMSFTEQLRQKEMESDRLKSIEERTHNIQYALIAIGIISFVILFLLLSHSTITNTKVITYLSILALLVVFEFLNLLLHPFLERVTHHSPLLMLLALVCIAALLIPLHHKLEKWTTHKLVEKNKAIRLASARRTIEQLEGKETDVNESSTNA